MKKAIFQSLSLLCAIVCLSGCEGEINIHLSNKSAPDDERFPTVEIVSVFEPAGESNVRSSFRIGEGSGLIGTEESGDIFKTTDKGLSWEKVFDGGNAWGIADVRNYIRAKDGHIYITTTEPAEVAVSKDEGESWDIVASAPASRTVGLRQLDNEVFLVGLRRSQNDMTSIIRSEDYFTSFDVIPLEMETPRQNVTCFGYWGGPSVLAGIGFEGTGKVYQSADYGLTWTQKAEFPDARDLMGFFKAGDDIYVLASGIATLFKSEDGGESWSEAHQFWSKGFLGECVPFTFKEQEFLIMSATDQSQSTYRHLVLISDDGGTSWHEWINLLQVAKGKVLNEKESGGGASNLAVLSNDTIVVGVGNHAVQGRAFTLKVGSN